MVSIEVASGDHEHELGMQTKIMRGWIGRGSWRVTCTIMVSVHLDGEAWFGGDHNAREDFKDCTIDRIAINTECGRSLRSGRQMRSWPSFHGRSRVRLALRRSMLITTRYFHWFALVAGSAPWEWRGPASDLRRTYLGWRGISFPCSRGFSPVRGTLESATCNESR